MLIDEIKRIKTYSVVYSGGECAYIEGYERIVLLSESEIRARCGKATVIIEGERLCLSEADDGSFSVVGKITAVREER